MWDYSIYLGNESDDIHIDFISTETLFVVASADSGIKKDAFKALFETVEKTITEDKVKDLNGFEKAIDKNFKKLEENTGFALAASLSVGNVLYVVTRGEGSIYINRGVVFQQLIESNNAASGYLSSHDLIVLTTARFIRKIPDANLKKFVQSKVPQEIVEAVTPDLKSGDDTGLIALFAQYQKQGLEEIEPVSSTSEVEPTLTPSAINQPPYLSHDMPDYAVFEKKRFNFNIKDKLTFLHSGSSLGKRITFVVLVVLVGIFIWSIILGNQRRERNSFIKKVDAQATIINTQLEEASGLTITNIDRALELLATSKSSYDVLKQEAIQKKYTDIEKLSEIQASIDAAEKSIKKEEEAATEEFYDLNLIQKGATATALYFDGTLLAMLDAKNAKTYLLNVEKKSVTTRKNNKISGGQYVALHQDEPYVFGKKDGISRITKEKIDLMVEFDTEWGNIQDFGMYNGNIYLLDSGKDEIYKYLVAEGGYSSKSSYIKSGKADLADATAMTIDGAVYITLGSRIMKFESGVGAGFSVKLPTTAEIEFDDIYTDRSLDKLYLLDKQSKHIFIVSKEGEFLKQLSASAIGRATDFVVDDTNGILILTGDTIIKIIE